MHKPLRPGHKTLCDRQFRKNTIICLVFFLQMILDSMKQSTGGNLHVHDQKSTAHLMAHLLLPPKQKVIWSIYNIVFFHFGSHDLYHLDFLEMSEDNMVTAI